LKLKERLMNQVKKNFIVVSESFSCDGCGHVNLKGDGFIRNHCCNCLCSKHLDENVPGDRLSECGELMNPIGILYNAKKGFIIVHKCRKCAKVINNKVAKDDNTNLIAEISSKGYVAE
jgi:hypothetical protein